MLRSISTSARPARCLVARQRQTLFQQQRCHSKVNIPRPDQNTKASIKNPQPPVLPGGADPAAPAKPPPAKAESPLSPPKKSAASASLSGASPTAPTQVPLTPPPPKNITPYPPPLPPPSSATPPPPPPPGPSPPQVPKKSHHFRNFLIGFTLLTGLSFGGGVFYSLKSDNFHDFFTEYIPFGEEAVLYFEEREFRRRFPNALSPLSTAPTPESPKITIPRSSGATWRLSEPEGVESTDVGKPGPHISGKKIEEQEAGVVDSTEKNGPDQKDPVEANEKPIPPSKDASRVAAVEKPDKSKRESNTGAIAPLELTNGNDPVVQDLVKVVNNIIRLVNSNGSSGVFDGAISSAKSELSHLNDRIADIKSELNKETEEKIKQKDLEFVTAAEGLLQKVNDELGDVESKWRDEFEKEREKLATSYREKLHTELQKSAEVGEQRLRNELLEQAIEMKRKWISEIKDRVEAERNGRLGKLEELSTQVEELEKLSAAWKDIIDSNLKTQKMHIALEAVRTAIDSPEQPKPFLRELAALIEVADDDDVVHAAITSINPRAYQTGISTPSQLIDRFRKVSEEVRKASLLPEEAGVAGHAASWILSKILFKKTGLAQGSDVESILTRTATYLEEGDLDNAAREMNQLKGWAKTLARDWLKEARLVLEVQQALDVIAAEARLQSLRVQEKEKEKD